MDTSGTLVTTAAPSFTDVLLAQKRIRPYLARTPLHSYPAINELIGTQVYIKHENYQPVGAFKVRGGLNLISQLSDDERARGVITGIHRQPRAVHRLRCAPLRRGSENCRARARQSRQGGRDARDGRQTDLSW